MGSSDFIKSLVSNSTKTELDKGVATTDNLFLKAVELFAGLKTMVALLDQGKKLAATGKSRDQVKKDCETVLRGLITLDHVLDERQQWMMDDTLVRWEEQRKLWHSYIAEIKTKIGM